MQLPVSPSLSRYQSLCLPTHSTQLTVRLCACRFVNKRVATADCALLRSLTLSRALRMLAFHREFPKQLPLHARVVVCVDSVWIAGVSLTHRFYEWTHVSGSTFAFRSLFLSSSWLLPSTCCRKLRSLRMFRHIVVVAAARVTLSLTLTLIMYYALWRVASFYCRLFSLPLRSKVQRLWGLRLLGWFVCCSCRKVTFEVHVTSSASKLKFFPSSCCNCCCCWFLCAHSTFESRLKFN